jgi:hypothetical protein
MAYRQIERSGRQDLFIKAPVADGNDEGINKRKRKQQYTYGLEQWEVKIHK